LKPWWKLGPRRRKCGPSTRWRHGLKSSRGCNRGTHWTRMKTWRLCTDEGTTWNLAVCLTVVHTGRGWRLEEYAQRMARLDPRPCVEACQADESSLLEIYLEKERYFRILLAKDHMPSP
jgi:hypothetical protein